MLPFLIRRTAGGLIALFCIVTMTFFLLRLMPGGPFDADRTIDPAVRKNLEHKWKLDRPLVVQYLAYLGDLARLDLGESIGQQRPVGEIIGEALPKSLIIGGVALAFAVVFGLGAGVLAAVRQNRFSDHLLMSASLLGFTVPNMVLGPLLSVVFGLWLRWLPVSDWNGGRGLVLPAAALGVAFAGRIARIMRASMLEVIREDFIRTARAKGLGETAVVFRHALRKAIAPLISYLGPAAAGILTGSVVLEKVFHIAGMGSYFISAPSARDYTLVMGIVLVYGSLLIMFNIAVDVVQALLNPRIRTE